MSARDVRAKVMDLARRESTVVVQKATCRKCHRPIEWVNTLADKRMPLDPGPNAGGNVVLRDGLAVVLKTGEIPYEGEVRQMTHMMTCPNAEEFRKRVRR